MGATASLAASRQAARRMTQAHAKTFYFASHVLPRAKRNDAYSVYAFCRYVDDEIDLTSGASAQAAAFARLQTVLTRACIQAASPEHVVADLPWLAAFRDTIHRREIPRSYFEELLEGVRMDCGPVELATWDELQRYCYHVASVVGLIMVHVLAKPAPGLLAPAQHLGTAMQLTNILRDIGEDWQRGRLYLPREELAKFGLTAGDIERKRLDDAFRALMRFQISRARFYYGLAEEGIAELPADGSRLTVRLMSRLYSAILDEIERAGYQVHSRRARVSFVRKVSLTVRTL